MYSIIYYSPTGNTKYLALYLKKCLGAKESKVFPLEFTDPLSLKEDDHLVLMFPIHGFNAPRRVKRFIKELPKKLYQKVSLIAVGCNLTWVNDAASLNIKKKLIKKGYQVYMDEVMAMPLTIVMGFPPPTVKELVKESRIKIREISKNIANNHQTLKRVPLKSKLISFVGKIESPAARIFGLELHAKKTCISCAICWENCPMDNIKQGKKDKPKFGFNCSMCLRCIYDCPTHAITPYISKFIPIKSGYKLSGEKED